MEQPARFVEDEIAMGRSHQRLDLVLIVFQRPTEAVQYSGEPCQGIFMIDDRCEMTSFAVVLTRG
jgi:hypothetical protein